MKPIDEDKRRTMMLGLGLDKDDGPFRVTRGDNFRLLGGSKPTHEKMQEVAVRVNEDLDDRHKTLEQVSPEEFQEIISKASEKVEE